MAVWIFSENSSVLVWPPVPYRASACFKHILIMYILLSGMELTLSDIFVVKYISSFKIYSYFSLKKLTYLPNHLFPWFESNVWVLLQSQTCKFVFWY